MKAQFQVVAMPNANRMRQAVTRTTFGLIKEAVAVHQSDFKARIKAPATVKHPIAWTSEAQRIKVMILLREANPAEPWYHRTGQLEAGWYFIAEQTSTGGSAKLENSYDQGKYVYGDFKGKHQQQFHKNSGWRSATEIRRETFQELTATMQRSYVETLLAFGFLTTSKV